VAVEVDSDPAKASQVVEGAARLELAEHHFKICLERKIMPFNGYESNNIRYFGDCIWHFVNLKLRN